jgi:hypothetical protein
MITAEPNVITGHDQIARARTADPSTSHEAACTVDNLTQKQNSVLWVFKQKGALTHETLQGFYQWYEGLNMLPRQSASGVRTRASELVALGKLKDSGLRSKTIGGRNAIVWEAV